MDIAAEKCVPASDSGRHVPRTHNLHKQHERQHSEQVVMRAEGRQPVNGDVVDPDDEHGHVDGQYAEHKDENGGGVVVEIIVGAGAGVAGEAQRPDAGAELYNREDHVGELVRNEGCDQQEEDGGCDESLAAACCSEGRMAAVRYVSIRSQAR